jgi:hypothetical protein
MGVYFCFQLLLRQGFYAANGTHRHKDGGLNGAMVGGDGAGTGGRVVIGHLEIEL